MLVLVLLYSSDSQLGFRGTLGLYESVKITRVAEEDEEKSADNNAKSEVDGAIWKPHVQIQLTPAARLGSNSDLLVIGSSDYGDSDALDHKTIKVSLRSIKPRLMAGKSIVLAT
ncbi:unnamed protein product [Timema podura]|uniref:Uncharacterized protein n=1 Tax=Timema podura TaxID=61482 RepID=A0ABN7NW69_TIMPD|nr:unnamed protein product [Timema podura]